MMEVHGATPTGSGSQADAPSPAVSAVPVSIPSAREMCMVWTTDAGLVNFSFPSNLSLQDVWDVESLLEVVVSGMVRRASAIDARSGETAHAGSTEGESAAPSGETHND